MTSWISTGYNDHLSITTIIASDRVWSLYTGWTVYARGYSITAAAYGPFKFIWMSVWVECTAFTLTRSFFITIVYCPLRINMCKTGESSKLAGLE